MLNYAHSHSVRTYQIQREDGLPLGRLNTVSYRAQDRLKDPGGATLTVKISQCCMPEGKA